LPSVPSIALGTGEVSLIDLTSAYGVFADNGALVPPHLIDRVEDSAGDVVWQSSKTPFRFSGRVVRFDVVILADVINRGTGSEARAQGFKLPAGGKTGTTTDSVDAWFVGYTPTLVAGVWFGRDQPEAIARCHGRDDRRPAWRASPRRPPMTSRLQCAAGV
jgi:penicillin-binding protein 1A